MRWGRYPQPDVRDRQKRVNCGHLRMSECPRRRVTGLGLPIRRAMLGAQKRTGANDTELRRRLFVTRYVSRKKCIQASGR